MSMDPGQSIAWRLRARNVPYGWLELADKAADEIDRLSAALRVIANNPGWTDHHCRAIAALRGKPNEP